MKCLSPSTVRRLFKNFEDKFEYDLRSIREMNNLRILIFANRNFTEFLVYGEVFVDGFGLNNLGAYLKSKLFMVTSRYTCSKIPWN